MRHLFAALLAALTVTACSTPTTPPATTADKPTGEITVFAAASLTEVFTALGKEFEAANPGTTVRFSFAGSSALAKQLKDGAPADVFASAAPATLAEVRDAGVITAAPTTFARNRLRIAVPKGNPGRVTGLADFADESRRIALCAAQVPCGAAAGKAFAAAGVTPKPDTLEQDVKAVLTKVRLGEVDAALVYRTDVAATTEVEGVDFPEADASVTEYPIAPVATAPNARGADAFIGFVRSDRGRAALTGAGFDVP